MGRAVFFWVVGTGSLGVRLVGADSCKAAHLAKGALADPTVFIKIRSQLGFYS